MVGPIPRVTNEPPIMAGVLEQDLCIGCGLCAAVCPASCLNVEFNVRGEYNPVEQPGCTGCGVCIKTCPFGPGNPNESSLGASLFAGDASVGKRSDCGYYHAAFVGYSTVANHHVRGASGGLTTWMLENLLASGAVDKVIAAAGNPDSDKLFKFVVVDDAEGVRDCARSSYYPLELSEVLSYVLANDFRYAIVGLPCFIKALRLAERANAVLAKRIVFHAGLVCGMLPSKFYAEYVAKLAGGDPARVKQVIFRDKRPDQPATNPLLTFRYDPASEAPDGMIEHLKGPCFAWQDWFFKHNACSFCDDVFAELADAVFMDAWLPGYSEKPLGHTLVITRTPEATGMIRAGIGRGDIAGKEMPIQRVTQSQQNVLQHKRERLSAMLVLRERQGKTPPIKRVPPAGNLSKQASDNLTELNRMRIESAEAWPGLRSESIEAFHLSIPTYIARKRREKRSGGLRRIPRAIKRVLRRLISR